MSQPATLRLPAAAARAVGTPPLPSAPVGSIIRAAMSVRDFFRSLSRNPRMRRLGRRVEHGAKRLMARALDVVLPTPPNEPVSAISAPQRVILVRPNFRIGNTLISAPLIAALHARFPGARLDVLGTDTTAILLRHFPIGEVYCISRRFILRPWELLALFRRLRRARYDIAVDASTGSSSSGLYAFLTGAPHRIGVTGSGERFLTTRLPSPQASHAYDGPVAFSAALGAPCQDRPAYIVSPDERGAALETLARTGLAVGAVPTPFVALSISGHKDKCLPPELWIELATRLAAAGGRVLVLGGPEELPLLPRLRQKLPPGATVLEPQPLRRFAALLSVATIVVAPDSGPLHLSVALGVPTVAVLIAAGSRNYAPRGIDDRVVFPATAATAAEVVMGHPRWMGGLRS